MPTGQIGLVVRSVERRQAGNRGEIGHSALLRDLFAIGDAEDLPQSIRYQRDLDMIPAHSAVNQIEEKSYGGAEERDELRCTGNRSTTGSRRTTS